MSMRGNQRGEGRVGFIIALAVVLAVGFAAAKVVPARITAYEFRDYIREQARMGAVRRDDATLAMHIMKKADELDVPFKRKQLKIRRTSSEIVITAAYDLPIDLKVYTYVYRFRAEERAPLF